jgi:hypothetical protein
MHVPGFTAERSLRSFRQVRSSEAAHPGFLRRGAIVPALSATGTWQECASGCNPHLLGPSDYSGCMSDCDFLAGGPGPTGTGGTGPGGGPPPSCTPHFSACFKNARGQWVRTFTNQNCQIKTVPC